MSIDVCVCDGDVWNRTFQEENNAQFMCLCWNTLLDRSRIQCTMTLINLSQARNVDCPISIFVLKLGSHVQTQTIHVFVVA